MSRRRHAWIHPRYAKLREEIKRQYGLTTLTQADMKIEELVRNGSSAKKDKDDFLGGGFFAL